MTDNELLAKVKTGTGISGTALDARLLQSTLAAKGYMSRYGISTEGIESAEGIQCLTVLVQDLMRGDPGEMKFSLAADLMMGQLHHADLPEVEE